MFDRVLFVSNLGVDIGLPNFRLGAYKNYLLPIARNLSRSKKTDIKILCSHTNKKPLMEYAHKSISKNISIIGFDDKGLDFGLNNFLVDSYKIRLNEQQKKQIFHALELSLGEGWVPDIVISWEAPTYILRDFYPDSLVLDVMPGMFARPPFPKMLSIDPVGLYKDCWYKNVDVKAFKTSSQYVDDFVNLRGFYENHFNDIDSVRALESLELGLNQEVILSPLQISNYFSWSENCNYSNQFDFVCDTLSHADEQHQVVFTQYVSFISERVINIENIEYFENQYTNFNYDFSFEKVDNISQYILPNVNAVSTISSTLGLQAKFFGKRLISSSDSHLSYIADQTSLKNISSDENCNIDGFMATFLGRTQFLQSRLNDDYKYLVDILSSFYERRNESGINKFPEFEKVDNSFERLSTASNFSASEKLLNKSFPSQVNAAEKRINGHKAFVSSNNVDVVSFDVFDTLVCRTVLHPVDVFYMMQKELVDSYSEKLNLNFVQNFAKFRIGAERAIRFKLDQAKDYELGEEMSIHEVYEEALAQAGLGYEHVSELVDLEQTIELSVLKPREPLKEIFYSALHSGKQVIIISDFIHDEMFVERVLRQAGYHAWDKLYVSTNVNLKKHTGSLFDYVLEENKINSSRMIHFGDNPHGDIKMAQSRKINARIVESGPVLAKRLLTERKANISAINNSFIIRAVLSIFASRFLKAGDSRCVDHNAMEFISNRHEFGFLAIGPAMNAFAKFILAQAESQKVKQILFFARDCKLPYEIIKNLQAKGKFSDLNICYIPVSRNAVAGMDLFSPADAINIRIDDFSKSALLKDLLMKRFLLMEEEISSELLLKWTKKKLDTVLVKDIPELGIYEIAQTSYKINWESFYSRIEENRNLFEKGLKQWGVDTSKDTIAVDFGYKGTIHRKVNVLFENKFNPVFFISHSSYLGEDPIDDLAVFYQPNLVPQRHENDDFLRFDLFLESIVNEPEGSSIGFVEERDGSIAVIREGDLDSVHKQAVKEIHEGVLDFAEFWNSECHIIDNYAMWEKGMMNYFFSLVMKNPSKLEASLLADIVFDNSYAGHEIRRFISYDKKGNPIKDSFWKQGYKAFGKSFNLESKKKVKSSEQVRLHWIVRPVLKKIVSENKVAKFDRKPKAFFYDSNSKLSYYAGLILIKS